MAPRGGCWPTAEQTDLLRAALLRGPEGVQAWERWKTADRLGRLDAASARLLGQLWRNLQRNGVADPLLHELKQHYRRTWYANQLRLRDTGVVLAALLDRGIEPMLLKGAALVVGYYGDAGLRPMEDVDILVRSEHAAAAAATLGELGWSSPQAVTPRHVRASHAMAFTGARGGQLDLHWHLLPESCWAGADAPLWERAAMLRVAGADAPCHGARRSAVPLLRPRRAMGTGHAAPVDRRCRDGADPGSRPRLESGACDERAIPAHSPRRRRPRLPPE